MNSLTDLEKKINSELTTKINKSEIKHNQLYLEIDKEDLIDVTLFLKTDKDTKFRQLIDVTVVDYPEKTQRFKMVYLFLCPYILLQMKAPVLQLLEPRCSQCKWVA